MKINNKIKLLSLVPAAMLVLASCNKITTNPTPITQPVQGTTPTLANLLDDPSYSIWKAAVTKAGIMPNLSLPTQRYTMFVPDDAACTASGISAAVITALPTANVTALVSYNVIPQTIGSGSIPTNFPNFQYPSIFNPAPSVSALLRLTTFPSKRGSAAWVNNIPVTAVDIQAVNGVLHKTALVVAPPTQYLWDRINTDANMTWLKAAILKADSGAVSPGPLQSALLNIGANFTVFAPTDAAFQGLLTAQITQALIAQGLSPAAASATAAALVASGPTALFSNPALFGVLTAQTVKGIVVYHIFDNGEIPPAGSRVLRPGRAFLNNFPTSATSYPTLLNSAIAAHPGVSIQATFAGPSVTAATVKGLGNATASTIAINPTPAPGGTSDQHYLNGVIHVINQVLLPQ